MRQKSPRFRGCYGRENKGTFQYLTAKLKGRENRFWPSTAELKGREIKGLYSIWMSTFHLNGILYCRRHPAAYLIGLSRQISTFCDMHCYMHHSRCGLLLIETKKWHWGRGQLLLIAWLMKFVDPSSIISQNSYFHRYITFIYYGRILAYEYQ